MNVNVSSVLYILLDSEFSLPYFLLLRSNLECHPVASISSSTSFKKPVLINPTPLE